MMEAYENGNTSLGCTNGSFSTAANVNTASKEYVDLLADASFHLRYIGTNREKADELTNAKTDATLKKVNGGKQMKTKKHSYTEAPAVVYIVINKETNEAYVGASENPNECIAAQVVKLKWGQNAQVEIVSEHWYWNSSTLYKQLTRDAIEWANVEGFTVVNELLPNPYYDNSFLLLDTEVYRPSQARAWVNGGCEISYGELEPPRICQELKPRFKRLREAGN